MAKTKHILRMSCGVTVKMMFYEEAVQERANIAYNAAVRAVALRTPAHCEDADEEFGTHIETQEAWTRDAAQRCTKKRGVMRQSG
jgi:hypothetical protein